ncbi:UNVERIFIED_CONTAM: hypothetical protein Sradi_3647600 [Sesamum radiatum]|uniref:Uncharacterized protein n=1 Tax=Sesamum radiatum TaxID=300843 RepID=A0AAW2QIJ3_SESRA
MELLCIANLPCRWVVISPQPPHHKPSTCSMFFAHVANHQALAAADSRLPTDHVRTPSGPSAPVRCPCAHSLPAYRGLPTIGLILCQPSANRPRPSRICAHPAGQADKSAHTLSASLPSPSAHCRPGGQVRPHAPNQPAEAVRTRAHCLPRASVPSVRIRPHASATIRHPW